MASAIRAQIKLDGGKAFADDFKKAASAVKSANAEMNYFTTALDKNGKSQDALQGKTKAMQSAFDAEQLVIDALTKRIEELSNMTGTDTTQAVDELTAELYKHKTAQAQLGDQVDDTTEDFSEFGKEVGVASAIASKAVDLVVEVGKKVFEIGKGAVEYNAQMESYSKTIEAFFKTSGQTAEEASKNTADLIANQKELAVATGIGADKLIDANKMLIASGVEGDKAQQAISALSKAIVATGGGNEELSRMASNLMQIVSVGKASSQDMKQFSMAGVDVYGLMAETTGKTVEQLKEMDITFEMIVEALDHATQEGGKFFEASQVGASTLNGQMNLLESTINEKLGVAFESVNQALSEKLIPAAIQLIEDIDWNTVGNAISFAVECVTDFVNAVDAFRNWYNEVYGQPAVQAIDAFNSSQEEAKQAFYENAGAVKVVDEAMANSLEEAKHFGNGMVLEFDGMKNSVGQSTQELSGEVKEELVDMGWEMMQQGVTDAQQLGQGIASGSIKPKTETKAMIDSILTTTNISSQGYTSGADFVSGFANGMHSNNSLIAKAASAIAATISSLLHFSRPEKGPLHEYETWMPDMMEGLQAGIMDNLWRVEDASSAVAASLTAPQMVTTYNGGINLTVNGAQGQDVNALVDEIMVRIQRATARRTAVWA